MTAHDNPGKWRAVRRPGQSRRKPAKRRTEYPRGEQIAGAVLTVALVIRILKLRRDYRFGAGVIADLLAEDGIVVKPRTIDDVIHRRSWAWVKID